MSMPVDLFFNSLKETLIVEDVLIFFGVCGATNFEKRVEVRGYMHKATVS